MKHDPSKIIKIQAMATKLRRSVVEMLYNAKSGHPGGALSSADIVSSLYFGDILKVFPDDPYSLIVIFFLSAGHYCPVWYAALTREVF